LCARAFLPSLPYTMIGSLMLHMNYSACILNNFMHVHAQIEDLHVYSRTPNLACLRMRLLISRAEQFSAYVCFYRGMSVSALIGCMHLSACGSRAEHLSACFKS